MTKFRITPTSHPVAPAPAADAVPAMPPRQAKTRRNRVYDASRLDLVATAASLKPLSTFTRAVRLAGLEDALAGSGPMTIFAPTNRAFARLPQPELDALLADRVRLAEVLRHHIVDHRVRAPRRDAPREETSVAGSSLTLTSRSDAFRVDDARLVKTNIRASNGVIHAIDTVLLPS
jgi:uncharacterized surface protein with fasciclin (FAS1) repeats